MPKFSFFKQRLEIEEGIRN